MYASPTNHWVSLSKDLLFSKAKKQGYKFTKIQLKKWKLKYHELIFGKPSYDIYIDDKSIFFDKNWTEKLKKKLR